MAEQLKLSDHGSKVLYKASGVLEAFLKRDKTSMHGLMRARALTRTGRYAQEDNQLEVSRSGIRKGLGMFGVTTVDITPSLSREI